MFRVTIGPDESVFRVSELSKCIVKPWLYIDWIFAVYAYVTGLNVYMDQLDKVSLQVRPGLNAVVKKKKKTKQYLPVITSSFFFIFPMIIDYT